jgi:hypothetical protein
MTQARRLLTLAYRANQRGETEIAARIATMAFAQEDAASLFEEIHSATKVDDEATDRVRSAEAAMRQAEASTQGSIFTVEGTKQLLAIAEKVHKAGFPKVAQSIARAAN